MSPIETAAQRRTEAEPAASDLRSLGVAIGGALVGPADPGWDAARQAWNLAVDQRPAAVALPQTAEDIVAVVDFARQHGLRIAPQGTGHKAGPLEHRLANSILVKTERMRAVEIELRPIARVYAGAMFWPQERAAEVLQAWREWTQQELPDEVISVGRVVNVPAFSEIPEFLRGRLFVVVEVVYLGEEAEGAELTAPLRALGPEMDTCATVPAAALSHLHMDPDHPVPGRGDGMLDVGTTPTPKHRVEVEAQVARVRSALSPWDASHHYMNFSDRPIDSRMLYPRAYTYHRVQAIKAKYDAADLIQSNHPIPPSR